MPKYGYSTQHIKHDTYILFTGLVYFVSKLYKFNVSVEVYVSGFMEVHCINYKFDIILVVCLYMGLPYFFLYCR